MSLSVDDDRRGRIRSRSLLSANRATETDLAIARDRSAAPTYSTSALNVGGATIRNRSPFEQPPVDRDDVLVHFNDPPSRNYVNDGSMYDYERRPAAQYQIPAGSSPRSSRDHVSSPRASAGAFQVYSPPAALDDAWRRDQSRERRRERPEDDLAYGKLPGGGNPAASSPSLGRTAAGAPRPQNPTYADSPAASVRYGTVSRDPASPSTFTAARILKDSQRASWYGPEPSASSPSVLTAESSSARRERDRSRARSGTSPQPLTGRMASLSVSTSGHHHHHRHSSSLSGAPASPMLENYHGTYQQVSPMPSPLLMASQAPENMPNIIDALSSSDDDRGSRRPARRARFHDPAEIAENIAMALKGTGMPDVEPLIEILPGLTHDQVMELRLEYKALVKTGADRKGVNVAKHLKARLKDEDPNLMKACFATALGRWESEAYWANFWYQSDKMRRELLIEALMGRTNDEIRAIKESFSDKKYDNSLTRCMRTELKEDKFKRAVMMVLEERRMDDFDEYGRRLPVDLKLVDQDVDDLYRAVKNDKGGETVMISIVVHRSDSHLREVLKEYERAYKSNFARECLKKSSNLVGEMMAHILNGIINKPVRDALLLHHALSASRKDPLRRELLISRLVRCHWDREHFARVKIEFDDRYGCSLQQAIAEATKGPLCDFLCELCITRTPDDVRRVERIVQ